MRITLFLGILTILNVINTYSYEEKGDSIIVQTLNFDDITKRSDSYLFPPLGKYERIIMDYTLKCDPRTQRDRFDCGEWDYLTYTVVTDSTGREKINRQTNKRYRVGNSTPDEFTTTEWPTKKYIRRLIATERKAVDENEEKIFGELPALNIYREYPKGLYHFIYEKSELPERFNHINLTPNENHNISLASYIVKMSDVGNFTGDANKTDYKGGSSPGENGMQLNNTINRSDLAEDEVLLIEMFLPDYSNNDNAKLSLPSEFKESFYYDEFRVLNIDEKSYVELDAGIFDEISNEITISFWAKGDASRLPRNTSILEAVNSENQRILNIHFPWSNGRVYWDAGNDGTNYDRIDMELAKEEYASVWNHWTFTKNATSGVMKIYLNGELILEGLEKQRAMSGISKFIIGKNKDLGNSWYGSIRDFAIWSKELDEEQIAENIKMRNDQKEDQLFYHSFTNYFTGLNYKYTDEKYAETTSWIFKSFEKSDYIHRSSEYRSRRTIAHRPNVQFNYVPLTDEVVKEAEYYLESFSYASTKLYEYDRESIDTVTSIEYWEEVDQMQRTPTDSMETYITKGWDYVYELENGQEKLVDSLERTDVTEYSNEEYYWYSPIINYEIDRFITPYGIRLDLGPDGFTWKIDVTDYAPILHDWVRFSAGNQQELIDVKFTFIKGTPARDIVDLKTVYRRSTYKYPQIVDETHLEPVTLELNPAASNWRVKTRSSGHRFGVAGTDNCAEFCNRLHSLWIDGNKEYEWEGWLECGDNPVYPQGGNWVSDRTDWCPGAPVTTYNHEITEAAKGKTSIEIDYDIEEKPEFTTYGDWVMNGMLVEYGEPNFALNASIDRIISPSDEDEFIRYNPICDDARIIVSNQGSEEINSIEFKYSIDDYEDTYLWEGSIEFTKAQEIIIPLFFDPLRDFINNPEKTFEIEIIKVNGEDDEYARNNITRSKFAKTDNYFNDFIMSLTTNDYSQFNINYVPMNYRLVNLNTNTVVFEGENPQRMSLVTEEAELEKGCYEMWLENTVGWGLSYDILAQSETNPIFLRTGNFKLENNDFTYRSFQTEFGNYIRHHFRVSDQITANYDTDVLDFGDIAQGETKTLTLKISPNNQLPLTIEKVELGSAILRGFSVKGSNPSLDDGPKTIQEGDELEIEIELTAKTDGLITGELTVFTNDARKSNHKIQMIANGVKSVGFSNDNLRLSVSPNPASGPLEIDFSVESSILINSSLILSDALGNKVVDLFAGKISISDQKLLYNPSNLASGIYYLTLSVGQVSKTIPIVISN
jgi:hypothetical protein